MINKIKNYVILGLLALLLISGGLNIYQNKIRKTAEIAADLDRANSNGIIAGMQAEVTIRDRIIITIRQERRNDSLQFSTSLTASKQRVSILQAKIEKLPKVIVYNPDSATVDSLRVAFSLKDSTINTQALMIMSLEVEKTGIFDSFHKEIRELELKNGAQVQVTNELQMQLVDEQGKVRKEVRKKKFFRFLATVGIVTAGIIVATGQ